MNFVRGGYMKKKIICKLIAAAVCICLSAQSLACISPAEVLAEEVSEENSGSQPQDMPEPEDEEPETDTLGDGASGTQSNAPDSDTADRGGLDGEPKPDKEEEESDGQEQPVKEKAEKEQAEGSADIEEKAVSLDETPEQIKISFEDEEKILIEIKKTKNKVNENPFDGAFYYKGSNMRPQLLVYLIEKVENGDTTGIEEKDIYKNDKGEVFKKVQLLTNGTDYTVSYPASCKALGKYAFTVKAVSGSVKYEGSKAVSYEVVEKAHEWSAWKTTVNQTVFTDGHKHRTCPVCGRTENTVLPKLKPTIKINMKTIPLQVKKSTTKFKVSGLAKGDSVKSYKSSNKKIFTVSKKGKITAKKKGTAKLTVTLASGKKATAKVKVTKGIVKTTKVSVNTSKLVLLKGGSYTLKTTRAPLTTQQKVTYSSSNKKIATVSSKGVIKAKKKGTVKITVKSGSKKKKITVKVQVPSFPKGDGTAFLKSCQKIANTIMQDGNWRYYSGSGTLKNSFAEARDYSPRQTNCANYVNFCMQDIGTLKPGMSFYSSTSAKIVYRGNSAQKAAVKKMVEDNYNIIKVGGKKAVKAGLKPGDICLFKGHMNVFAGLDSKGVPLWYDAGRNSTSDGKPESGYFTNMYRASYYNSLPVYIVLRLK